MKNKKSRKNKININSTFMQAHYSKIKLCIYIAICIIASDDKVAPLVILKYYKSAAPAVHKQTHKTCDETTDYLWVLTQYNTYTYILMCI